MSDSKNEENKILLILRGLPGAGKSTFIKNNCPKNTVVCSADLYHINKKGQYVWKAENIGRAHTFCRETFLEAIEKQAPHITIDNTNTMVKEMDFYYRIARESGYQIMVVHLDINVDVSFSRNVHKVPYTSIQNMAKRFQSIPESWEVEQKVISTIQ